MRTIDSQKNGFFRSIPLEVFHLKRHANSELHTHDFSELVIILQGSAIHRSPAGEYPISAGDVFVLHEDQAHGYRDTNSLELINILFRMDQLALILRDIQDLPAYHALFTLEPAQRNPAEYKCRLRLTPEQLGKVSDRLHEMLIEHNSHPPGWQFTAVAQFMLIVSDLCRAYSKMDHPAAQSLVRLGRVVGYIHQNYAEHTTLDTLADLGNMSKRTLTREFTRLLGVSPIEYLIHERVTQSMQLLMTRDITISEAAFQVGFQDSNYFSRMFRKVYGHSPREFRKVNSNFVIHR